MVYWSSHRFVLGFWLQWYACENHRMRRQKQIGFAFKQSLNLWPMQLMPFNSNGSTTYRLSTCPIHKTNRPHPSFPPLLWEFAGCWKPGTGWAGLSRSDKWAVISLKARHEGTPRPPRLCRHRFLPFFAAEVRAPSPSFKAAKNRSCLDS